MFCPNYKNKEVKDGFNEIVVALGGQPLTDEEFRSSELRNQRTGVNYSAMETAYKVYHRNGGNFLDMTPDGKPSILFLTLLDHFDGDRASAIIAKSNVYSDEFAEWFGDWWGPLNVEESEDIKYGPISKVVDENGEPLVVWHNSKKSKIIEYDMSRIGTNGGTLWGPGIYSSRNKHFNSIFGNIENALYVNIKKPFRQTYYVEDSDNELEQDLFIEATGLKKSIDDIPKEFRDKYDGTIADGQDGREYVAWKNTDIKHVENLGTWDPNDPNIYHVSATPNTTEYRVQQVYSEQFLGKESFNNLSDGKFVQSSTIISNMLGNGVFSEYNNSLAEVLAKHNIPIRFSSLPKGKPMATAEYSDGTIIVEIDPEQLPLYSQEDAAEYLLHEVVHALSVKAIRKPVTEEEKDFRTATIRVYETFDKLIPESEYSRSSMDSGAYILADEFEFAAVFATDKTSKLLLYSKAKEADLAGNNKVWLRLKRFINAFTRLLVNKNVFKGINQDELALYEKNINNFLKGRKVNQQNTDIIKAFNENLKALTPDVLNRK